MTSFSAKDFDNDGKYHILLAASGSVATIKLPLILDALSEFDNFTIRVILTESAKHFLNGQSPEQPVWRSLSQIPNVEAVYSDHDEWPTPGWTRSSPILHIELRKWADLLVITPLSANTLAKIAGGFADNLLTSVVRAWDTKNRARNAIRPIAIAPAMNTEMWDHPVTKKHLNVIDKEWGLNSGGWGWFLILNPTQKTLACGDTGMGAMMEVPEIVDFIVDRQQLWTQGLAR